MKNENELIQELKELWGTEVLKVVGLASEHQKTKKKRFGNIRLESGTLLQYPDGGRIFLTIPDRVQNVNVGEYYEFVLKLAPKKYRERSGNNYLLQIDLKFTLKPTTDSPEKFVRGIFKEYEETGATPMKTIIGGLRRIIAETNKKPETFIYELVQNADDYPDPVSLSVDVSFSIQDGFLVLTHNGAVFNQGNVQAICTADAGDKEEAEDKIGFKGIGFKSIFKVSNFVWLHSGDFTFRFDESYFAGKGVSMPWQVMPIWTAVSSQYKSLAKYLKTPVTIVIKPCDEVGYLSSLEDVFCDLFQSDQRVLLFLRHVRSIQFTGQNFSFKTTVDEKEWVRSRLDPVEIKSEIQEYLIKAASDSGDPRIPMKYSGLSKSILTFATKRSKTHVLPTDDAKLYVYLPTELDFGFKFLINGDFIPDGSRDRLFEDIELNGFLFESAGFKFVEWLAQLTLDFGNVSAYSLIPDLKNLSENERDNTKRGFLHRFKIGFDAGLSKIPFVLAEKNSIELLSNCFFDETGVFDLLGAKIFHEAFNVRRKKVLGSVAETSTVRKLLRDSGDAGVFSFDDLKVEFDSVKTKLLSPTVNAAFIELLVQNDKLHDFKEKSFALGNSGRLSAVQDLYRFVPEKRRQVLNALGIDWIHPDVHSSLTEHAKDSFVEFDEVKFVVEWIPQHIESVNSSIDSIELSLEILGVVENVKDGLSQRALKCLSQLNLYNENDEVVENACDKRLYFPNSFIECVIGSGCLPIGHVEILSSRYEESGLAELMGNLFEVCVSGSHSIKEFVFANIIDEVDVINSHLEDLSTDEFKDASAFLLSLWFQIESDVTTNESDCLGRKMAELLVLTNEGQRERIHHCFLPKEYTDNDEVESLIESFGMELPFVSDTYLNSGSASKGDWRRLFKRFRCQSDHLDFVRDTLLPNLDELSPEQLIKGTRLIARYKGKLSDEIAVIEGFPVVTNAGVIDAKEAFYNRNMIKEGDPQIVDLWSMVSLEQELVSAYSSDGAMGSLVMSFLHDLGLPYPDEDYPLQFILEDMISNPEFERVEHLKLFSRLIGLFESKKLKPKSMDALHGFQLLTKDEESPYAPSTELIMGTIYRPKLDFEPFITNGFSVVSDVYYEEFENKRAIKSFLNRLGCSDGFRVLKSPQIWRRDLPDWFTNYVEEEHPYVRQNARDWAGQHRIMSVEGEGNVKRITNIDLLQERQLNRAFWNQFLTVEDFRNDALSELSYKTAYRAFTLPSHLEVFMHMHPTLPNLNGEQCFAHQLYSNQLRDCLKNDNMVCSLEFGNLSDVEKRFGIKQSLDLEGVIAILRQKESFHFLKKHSVLAELKCLIEDGLDADERQIMNDFVSSGEVMNQKGEWVPISELYMLEEGLDLGTFKNRWLLHPEFVFMSAYLGCRVIKESDFEFHHSSSKLDLHFKSRLLSRLPFLAFVISPEKSSELELRLKEVMEEVCFYDSQAIKLIFQEDTTLIERSDLDCWRHEGDIYFRGPWNGLRATGLFGELAQLLELPPKIRLHFREILLVEGVADVKDYIESIGLMLPPESRQFVDQELQQEEDKEEELENSKALVQENNEKNEAPGQKPDSRDASEPEKPSRYSSEEEALLKELFADSLSNEEKADHNLEAHIKAMIYFESMGYDTSIAQQNFHENFKSRFIYPIRKQGKELKVMCRSAVDGLLYLGAFAWAELEHTDVELYVLLGKDHSDCQWVRAKSDLSSENADYWILRRAMDENTNGLDALINAEEEQANLQVLINMKESRYSRIFKFDGWESKSNAEFGVKTGNEDEV